MDKSSKSVYAVRVVKTAGEARVVAKSEEEAINLVNLGLEEGFDENPYTEDDGVADEGNVYNITDDFDDEELDDMERHQEDILRKQMVKEAKMKEKVK